MRIHPRQPLYQFHFCHQRGWGWGITLSQPIRVGLELCSGKARLATSQSAAGFPFSCQNGDRSAQTSGSSKWYLEVMCSRLRSSFHLWLRFHTKHHCHPYGNGARWCGKRYNSAWTRGPWSHNISRCHSWVFFLLLSGSEQDWESSTHPQSEWCQTTNGQILHGNFDLYLSGYSSELTDGVSRSQKCLSSSANSTVSLECLRFALQDYVGVPGLYQRKGLPFGPTTTPRVFTKLMLAAAVDLHI